MAQGASGPAVTNTLRVLVKLTQPSDDAELIAKRASASAGVSVRYVASVSPQWHSLSLACRGEADCDAAMQRMRDDSIHFEAVQRDGMSRPLSPPSSSRS